MPLQIGLLREDELSEAVAAELRQIITAVQVAWARREAGVNVSLTLGLQYREQLDPIVADELDQVIAAIQVAFNSPGTLLQRSVLNRVQPVNVTLTGTATSATAALSVPVDVTKTVLMIEGFYSNNLNVLDNGVRVTLTDAQTITATRLGGTVGDVNRVRVNAVEWYSSVVKSVEYGTVAIADAVGSNYQALSRAVDAANALVLPLGAEFTANLGTQTFADFPIYVNFSDSAGAAVTTGLATTVTATRGSANCPVLAGFVVVQF